MINDMIGKYMVNPSGILHDPIATQERVALDNARGHLPVKFG
jgi:hypothetical protein